MSTLANEILLENIYEEVMSELIDTETLAKYSEEDIYSEVLRRFEGISDTSKLEIYYHSLDQSLDRSC